MRFEVKVRLWKSRVGNDVTIRWSVIKWFKVCEMLGFVVKFQSIIEIIMFGWGG